MNVDAVSLLTLALVLVTAYYAWEVKRQTNLLKKQTDGFFNNAKRDRLEKEINLLITPILHLENHVKINPYYWNWHDAITLSDEDLDYVKYDEIRKISDEIDNIAYYKYLSPEYLLSVITIYQENLRNIEGIRKRFSKPLNELEKFGGNVNVKLAYEKLRKSQDDMFKAANTRYSEILDEFKRLKLE